MWQRQESPVIVPENYGKTNSPLLKESSHKEIWARLQSGCEDALLALYDKYYLTLMHCGLRLTGDRDLTNDCITQVLLRLWDRRKDLPMAENPQSYLCTCLRHELLGERKAQNFRTLRALKFYRTVDESEPSYEEYLIQRQSNKGLKEKLAQTFKKLTSREQELLQLKFFENLDYSEISLRCGITKRTAYNIVHAALKTLKAGMTSNQNISVLYDITAIALLILLIVQ